MTRDCYPPRKNRPSPSHPSACSDPTPSQQFVLARGPTTRIDPATIWPMVKAFGESRVSHLVSFALAMTLLDKGSCALRRYCGECDFVTRDFAPRLDACSGDPIAQRNRPAGVTSLLAAPRDVPTPPLIPPRETYSCVLTLL